MFVHVWNGLRCHGICPPKGGNPVAVPSDLGRMRNDLAHVLRPVLNLAPWQVSPTVAEEEGLELQGNPEVARHTVWAYSTIGILLRRHLQLLGLSIRYLVGAWLFAAFSATYADTFDGKVVGVADGDTLTALVNRKKTKVRLLEIDAPERKQAFGTRSRQSLGELCGGKTATVQWTAKDRNGRVLGRVFCEGVDTNAEQVRRGMAWVFDQYVRDRSLYAVQDEAKAARRGLWADASPVPPWEWRQLKRKSRPQ